MPNPSTSFPSPRIKKVVNLANALDREMHGMDQLAHHLNFTRMM